MIHEKYYRLHDADIPLMRELRHSFVSMFVLRENYEPEDFDSVGEVIC